MQEWFARIPSLELAEPWWLLLLPVLLLAAWFKERHERRGKGPAILFPGLESLRDLGFGAGRILRLLPQWLRWSALFLSVIALAGPHLLYRQTEAEAMGIDVMLVLLVQAIGSPNIQSGVVAYTYNKIRSIVRMLTIVQRL